MKPFIKSIATVFIDDKKNYKVMLPSGEVIPYDVKSVTINRIGFNEVTVTFSCNITISKEVALAKYKKK